MSFKKFARRFYSTNAIEKVCSDLHANMKRVPRDDDESIDSDALPDQPSDDDENSSEESDSNLDNLFTETPDEIKTRLTKEYIEKMRNTENDDETINERLTTEYEEETGKKFTPIILKPISSERYRAHERGWPTAFALGNGLFFSAAKDGSIVRYKLDPRSKFDISPPSDVSVLCISYEPTKGKLATGDSKGIVTLWDSENGMVLLEMKGHKGPVTGVIFQNRTSNIRAVTNATLLFSCSYDRTVRVWDCETGNCLSTLYGHQMEIISIDYIGNAVTVGADRTLRQWRYEAEKQLLFQGGGIKASIDCVSLFNSGFCVTGSQDGRICYWDLTKKKPLYTLASAHDGKWITSICAFRFHRFFASGSYDGKIKFWKITDDNKIEFLFEYEIEGYANDMHFTENGEFLAVQISQEQRLGRWLSKIRAARPGVHYIKMERISD